MGKTPLFLGWHPFGVWVFSFFFSEVESQPTFRQEVHWGQPPKEFPIDRRVKLASGELNSPTKLCSYENSPKRSQLLGDMFQGLCFFFEVFTLKLGDFLVFNRLFSSEKDWYAIPRDAAWLGDHRLVIPSFMACHGLQGSYVVLGR